MNRRVLLLQVSLLGRLLLLSVHGVKAGLLGCRKAMQVRFSVATKQQHQQQHHPKRPTEIVSNKSSNNDKDLKNGLLVVSTLAEAVALVSILQGSLLLLQANDSIDMIQNWRRSLAMCMVWKLPLVQWMAILGVVFGLAGVRSILDGTIQAAAQTLRPTVTPGDPQWYANLKKPWFNPPAWLFPIMWLIVSKPTQVLALRSLFLSSSSFTVLSSSSVSSYSGSSTTSGWKLFLPYCLHLALGETWNHVFFQRQRIGLAATVIGLFWTSLMVSIWIFDEVNPVAGYMMLPTAAWVTVASLLNLEIYRLNRILPPKTLTS